MNKPNVLISACLFGEKCRYDGKSSFNKSISFYKDVVNFISFCPEQLGGLPTPRPASNIFGGDGMDVLLGKARVINVNGVDVTENFKIGAYKALEIAQEFGVSLAIMKDKSPSCGIKTPYCETASGYGMGVTAALFKLYGIKIIELGKKEILYIKELFSSNSNINHPASNTY